MTKTKIIKKDRTNRDIVSRDFRVQTYSKCIKKDKIYSSKPNTMKKTDALCPENMGAY